MNTSTSYNQNKNINMTLPFPVKTVNVWYSTDLSRWEDTGSQILDEQDILVHGKAYRRLDPDFFAWLLSRMKLANKKYKKCLLPAAVYNPLRINFNTMQDEAIQLFGESVLLAACETLEFQSYEPPSIQTVKAIQSLSESGTPLAFYTGPWSTRIIMPDPTLPPNLIVGVPVHTRSGKGIVIAVYPADEHLPEGWVEVQLADGNLSQTDVRYITDAYNRCFVPMTYTDFEKHVFELASNDKNQNADDILPDLNFPLTGNWKFSENVDLLDYLKVWEIKDAAMASGWSYADLFQNRGEYPMPCGQDYGLVCFVHGRNIGNVTADDIELISKKNDHGRSLKFQRPRQKEIKNGTTAQTVSECKRCAS